VYRCHIPEALHDKQRHKQRLHLGGGGYLRECWRLDFRVDDGPARRRLATSFYSYRLLRVFVLLSWIELFNWPRGVCCVLLYKLWIRNMQIKSSKACDEGERWAVDWDQLKPQQHQDAEALRMVEFLRKPHLRKKSSRNQITAFEWNTEYFTDSLSLSIPKSTTSCIVYSFYWFWKLSGFSHCSNFIDFLQLDFWSNDLYSTSNHFVHWVVRKHEASAKIPSNGIGSDRNQDKYKPWHRCSVNKW